MLLVDGDPVIGRHLDDDLVGIGAVRLLAACDSSGQVDVGALLRHRQGGHEDHEQHEQHVDERRDVHVRAASGTAGREHGVGAGMLPGDVRHDSPPARHTSGRWTTSSL